MKKTEKQNKDSLSIAKNKDLFKNAFIKKVEEVSGDYIDESTLQNQYEALAQLVMDEITTEWAANNSRYNKMEEKQIYFFSIEFLIGRLLKAYINNLGWDTVVPEVLEELGLDYDAILAKEDDPALGNGGLGRLMACFLDSTAAMGFPGHGNGIRYKFGLFEQKIINAEQVEVADNWLKNGYPFEIAKPDKSVIVKYKGDVRTEMVNGKLVFIHENYEPILAVPYDVPIQGYHNKTVNSLRLWSARPVEDFDLSTFNQGHFLKAMQRKSEAEAISQILYPNDNGFEGKQLRLKQEYFFVCAGLKRIVRRYKKFNHGSLDGFSDKICIHINDTHPALCVPELMRILVDEENYEWDNAWDMTVKSLSFTNHTVLPEALEKWPTDMMKELLPRVYQIVEEINRRFVNDMNWFYPNNEARNYGISIIKDGQVHMAHLAIIGSHSINGVAELHSKILREETFKDFYSVFPERFHSVTNGVTPRRFLMSSNPNLKNLLTETIGSEWTTPNNLSKLKYLITFATDASFQSKLATVKRQNKERLSQYVANKNGIILNPDSIFDIQVKRIHEYKRQLLNALHIMYLYNQLKSNPNMDFVPKTFIFAGKAAPSYYYAKEVIRLINVIADKINNDPDMHDRLKVVFLANFNVSVAEIIYPAAEISEQISTAGKEASGTGNMKFMMNGALTLGTMDGANVEIAESVGMDNIFTFGLSDVEVSNYYISNSYRSLDIYESDPRIQKVLNQLINGFFGNAATFQVIYDSLLLNNDHYFVLKDFAAYADIQSQSSSIYQNSAKWLQMSTINIAHSGMFSSDRSITDYQREIWKIK
ncbi:MAG: glycogen/starch/alpha-glucan phosphorylase [Eubacterium sp.]